MYSCLPSFVLGFHGCDKSIGEKILAGTETLRQSSNDYDWLGHGIYFWENNPTRALEYAKALQHHPERGKGTIKTPFVIGAIIDLGHCLNLLDSKHLQLIKEGFEILASTHLTAGIPMPTNKSCGGNEVLIRKLDCAVIETTHSYNKYKTTEGPEIYEYDSTRGVFTEGKELYPDAGFKEKSHIQICVRNPNCIKGYFRIEDQNLNYRIP